MADHPTSGRTAPDPDGDPSPAQAPPVPQSPERFWIAAVVSTGLGFLAGWLLMPPLAPILYVLGLFFFLLVGLLIGAATYRIALPAAPISRRRLLALTAVVSLTLWSAALIKEYLHLSYGAYEQVRKSFKINLKPEQRQEIEAGVRQHVAATLKRDFPPGGLLGYLQWSLRKGEMDVPKVLDRTQIHISTPQRGFLWAFRVVFSLLFVAGAFASQILPLGPPRPVPAEPSDAESTKV